MAVRNFTHGQLKIIDGANKEKFVLLDEGNVNFSETKTAAVVMSRGRIKEFAEGIEQPIEVSFSIYFSEYFSLDRNSAVISNISIRDFFTGNYSGSRSRSNCGPHTVRLELIIDSPCRTGSNDKNEVLYFDPFHLDSTSFTEEEESNKLEFTGKALHKSPNSNIPNRTAV